jgi:hypothetical protein
VTLGHRRSRIGALWALADLASGGDLRLNRTIQERGLMPILTATALLARAYAARWRRPVSAAIGPHARWRAALVGSLVNDAGPVLLAYRVVVLAFATAYAGGNGERAR